MKWQEPPAPAAVKRTIKYQGIADELRTRPGEWALILTGQWRSMAAAITSGGLAAFRPRGAFEARYTGAGGGKDADIYARYVGEPAPVVSTSTSGTEGPVKPVERAGDDAVRADERERIARYVESMRVETWNGGTRRVNNAGFFADVIRRLS